MQTLLSSPIVIDLFSLTLPSFRLIEQSKNRALGTHIENDSNHIDSTGLDHIFYLIKSRKGKADTLYPLIFFALLTVGVLAEGDTVVICNGCEALVGNLDLTV